MNTDQFGYFSYVYETLHYAVAAKRIPMSQPGLIKAIKNLENTFGVPFFFQGEKGTLIRTSYADAFYHFVNDFEESLSTLQIEFEKIKAQEKNEIRVGFSNGIIGLLGPNFIYCFEQQHPDILFSYREYMDLDCDEALRDGHCDLAFCQSPYEKNFVTTTLYEGTVEFWVNCKNPLSEKDNLSIEDLDGQSIAMPGRNYKCYNRFHELCTSHDVTPARLFETVEIFQTFEYALRNLGLGYTNRHLKNMGVFSQNENVRCLPIDDWPWVFGLSYLPAHKLTPAEWEFYNFTLSFIQENDLDKNLLMPEDL